MQVFLLLQVLVLSPNKASQGLRFSVRYQVLCVSILDASHNVLNPSSLRVSNVNQLLIVQGTRITVYSCFLLYDLRVTQIA